MDRSFLLSCREGSAGLMGHEKRVICDPDWSVGLRVQHFSPAYKGRVAGSLGLPLWSDSRQQTENWKDFRRQTEVDCR